MRESIKNLEKLLLARIECIWIESYEEKEIIEDIKEILQGEYKSRFRNINLQMWSRTEGVIRVPLNVFEEPEEADKKLREIPALFEKIRQCQNEDKEGSTNIWILRDLHSLISDPKVQRSIRDLKEYQYKHYNPIIVISPSVELPDDVSRLFRVIEYGLPNEEMIQEIVVKSNEKIIEAKTNSKEKNKYTPVKKSEIKDVVKSCIGLTVKEIDMVLRESMIKFGTLNRDFIADNKIQIVKKTGVLDYKIPSIRFEDIGGNQAIKDWLMESKNAFDEQASAFGLSRPKGYMAVGLPGAGKTALAEAFADELHIPFLELNLSKIMDRLVGQSERRIAHALNVVKACSPCVFLIDEVEKLLGNVSGGQNGDSGVTARIMAALLKFMNDNDSGVYVIMTSNDVSQLPPEFTRAGRLDGTWYFGLPSEEERQNIFQIHFRLKHKEVGDLVLQEAVRLSDGYTGAEIKQSVENTMRKAFSRYLKDGNNQITIEDVTGAINEVIPISQSSREKILALENYCKTRAKNASYKTEEKDEFSAAEDDNFLLNDL